MNDNPNRSNREFPRISGEEFKFILKNSGFTYKQFASSIAKSAKSTIWRWTKQDYLKPYQVELVEVIIYPDSFKWSRDLWKQMQEKKALEQAEKEGEESREYKPRHVHRLKVKE